MAGVEISKHSGLEQSTMIAVLAKGIKNIIKDPKLNRNARTILGGSRNFRHQGSG